MVATPPEGVTALAIVGGPPPCPPYIILGVYKPSDEIKLKGCIYKVGIRGAITVPFFPSRSEVPLVSGQIVRFAPGHGYYAFPPSG